MVKEKTKLETGDEFLTIADQRALALIRESLGQRGYDNARLLLLREHARRVVKVTPEQIEGALAFTDDNKGGRVGTMNLLARKFVMDDPGRVVQFRNYLSDLRDGKIEIMPNSVACEICGGTFRNKASLRNHTTMAHTSAGKRVRMAAKRTRKKRNG